jgi:eukaryotic-like serine/threonine-protein kinase
MTAAEFLSEYVIDFTRSLDQRGLGTVYIAKELSSDKFFAVKVIELHPLFDKGEVLERFNQAASLSHPNLLPYFKVLRFPTEESVQHFILMPYIKAGTVQDQLEELNFSTKIDILKQVLEGLAYLHDHQTVWQSLRSDHILLVEEEGKYVAKFINYGAKIPINKAFFYNYEYLAPEQLSETADTYFGPATDIWAFGVLAFEVFTGMLPFGRKTVQTPNRRIMERVLQEEPADLFHKIPDSYKEIIKRCLQKNSDERWTDIQSIINYLDENPAIKPKIKQREVGILETLEKMGEEKQEPENIENNKKPLLQRKFKRKPSRPLQWWEPFLWIGFAILVGYLLSKI